MALRRRFPDNVLYIYEKQLEEADLIVLNKADRLAPGELAELIASLTERFPGKTLVTMSALTGEGVDAWLEYVAEQSPAGQQAVDVDYDTYAAGEAALGWLNASVVLRANGPLDWQAFAEDLLEATRQPRVTARGAEIAHVKLFIGRGHHVPMVGQGLTGNLTSNQGPASVRGSLDSVADQVGDANQRPRTHRARRAAGDRRRGIARGERRADRSHDHRAE